MSLHFKLVTESVKSDANTAFYLSIIAGIFPLTFYTHTRTCTPNVSILLIIFLYFHSLVLRRMIISAIKSPENIYRGLVKTFGDFSSQNRHHLIVIVILSCINTGRILVQIMSELLFSVAERRNVEINMVSN